MNFKDFFILREAKVLPPSYNNRTRKTVYPDAREPMKDTDTIRVYHAFNDPNDLYQLLRSGLSGEERANRRYSYEFNNNPKGLFVTISLDVAKEFGNYIIEFHAPMKDLEAPVWPSGGFTVQGQMAQYFDGPEDRENARMSARDRALKSEYDSIKNSDRPELADLLINSGEQQALFTGSLNWNSVRAIWENPTPQTSGKYSTYKKYKVSDYIRLHKKEILGQKKHQNKMFSPREKFDIETFLQRLEADYKGKWKMTRDDLLSGIKMLDQDGLLTYVWPNQLEDAWKAISELNK